MCPSSNSSRLRTSSRRTFTCEPLLKYMSSVSTDAVVSFEKLGLGWLGTIPPKSDEVGLEMEDRGALREGNIPPRLVAGEYVGGGNVGIKFTFSGGNFAGISRGPRGVVDGEDKEASCGSKASELEREVPKCNLSNRAFKSKELGEVCLLAETDSCSSGRGDVVPESGREPRVCESAPLSEKPSQL